MAEVTLKGKTIHTNGYLPKVGSKAPDFVLVDTDLNDKTLADFQSKYKVLSIVPSLDTAVCALSAKKFNERAKKDKDITILNISSDLPFAVKRFCSSEQLDNIHPLSIMRSKKFSEDYGILIIDGPLAGLTCRAVVILDENNQVLYHELVPEIAQEPDYDKALSIFR